MANNAALAQEGGIADRLRSIDRAYYAFNQMFTVAAAFGYQLMMNDRIIFEWGADDNQQNTANSGYVSVIAGAQAAQPPSVDMTNCFKGGAFSDRYVTRLLSLGIVVAGPPRYALNATVGWAAGAGATAPYTSNNPLLLGVSDIREYQLVDQLFAIAMKNTILEQLPVGAVTGCSDYLGLPQLMSAGTSWNNSGLPSMGLGMPSARWSFGKPLYFRPATGDSNYQPNRIRLTMVPNPAAAAARSQNTISQNPGFAARVATDWLCLDLLAVADFAFIQPESFDADGNLVREIPVSDHDAQKIAQFSQMC
jgi:hypothetical protein